jgi:hypothetical protein
LTLTLFAQAPTAPAQQPTQTPAAPPQKAPDYPPFADVTKEYEKVSNTVDGVPTASMYTIWQRKKDNQLLAELPGDYVSKKYFIALTVSSGETFAGLQAGDMYVYWRPYDKRLALIEPNIRTRSTGDQESVQSVKRLFTDRVILDIPILTMSPSGGPVIDLDALLVGQASRFFGSGVQITNPALARVIMVKAFPQNIEVRFEAPTSGGGGRSFSFDGGSSGGRLKEIHYSISVIPDSTGYQPRVADNRVGYFTTSFTDLGKFKEDDKRVRYINRWKLEKADPNLKLSPPKDPIVFYLEHTTPVRYRPWVKRGVLYWNKAFEKVGIRDAIVVEEQNFNPKRHMDKDPEDVRYNFIRWLANDVGTAIGPSRVHPMTGEILDADIILTDGWIRHFVRQHMEVLPSVAMEGFGPETLAWLETHPTWDPRILLAPPSERPRMLAERAARGPQPLGGHPMGITDRTLMGNNEYDGLIGRVSQVNGLCMASEMKAMDVQLMRMMLELVEADDPKKDEKKDEKKEEKKEEKKDDKPKGDILDGLPDEFIGPLLADLVAHEVGHTLGLRHNFRASAIYSMAEINSNKVKGKPFSGSVMDYLPINFNMQDGEIQGDYAMIDIGAYDMWAIEYGYTFDKDLKPILNRVASPELQYGSDEDTGGPDPLVQRYDFSSNPLDYAKNQMRLAKFHRERLIEKFVKDGDSWAKARRGYELTLQLQTKSLSMMSDWVGGAFVHRDKKGDKDARPPLEVVPTKAQREAVQFCIENAFYPESFGLTPEILRHLAVENWLDSDGGRFRLDEADWPVHDRIMGIQASTLTMLLNPTTLRRVYDNEFRLPADQDALTLPELMDTVCASIWSELEKKPAEPTTARKPWISSLRRNLQREHLERLIELTLPDAGFTAAYKPISNLAIVKLRDIKAKIAATMENKANMDPYSVAHLSEAQVRIEKALDAQYIYNAGNLGGGGLPSILFLREQNAEPPRSIEQ